MGREAHPAQIGNNNPVIFDKHGSERGPHIACIAEAVKHHDCRTLPSNTHIEHRAIRRHLLSVNAWGKRLNLCRGSGRDANDQQQTNDKILPRVIFASHLNDLPSNSALAHATCSSYWGRSSVIVNHCTLEPTKICLL